MSEKDRSINLSVGDKLAQITLGKINSSGSSIEILQRQIGQNLQKHIQDKFNTVGEFAKKSGVSTSSLYRLFAGENVSIDNFLRALRTAKMDDAISALLSPPDISPADAYIKANKGKAPVLPDTYKPKTSPESIRGGARSAIDKLTSRKP